MIRTFFFPFSGRMIFGVAILEVFELIDVVGGLREAFEFEDGGVVPS